MQRGSLDDLRALILVGREMSFTKAAAKLGVSQPALSHTIRQLEARVEDAAVDGLGERGARVARCPAQQGRNLRQELRRAFTLIGSQLIIGKLQ